MANAVDLLLLGAIMLMALGAHWAGQWVHVPRVTILLLLGTVAGPQLLDLLPEQASDSFSLFTQLTLALVGFLLGERMSFKHLAEGREGLIVSLAVTLATAALVFIATYLVTGNLVSALLLAGIAPATAPAATLDVLKEAGARGRLTRLVYQVVAIDDVWCAMLFSILLVAAELVTGNGYGLGSLWHGSIEIFGSIVLGFLLGLPMAWLTGRIMPGEPMLLESAGFAFAAAGLAGLLDLSYLLTCMTLGITVANRAKHHIRPFRSIEGISEPFLAIFFFMAGYSMDWQLLPELGLLGVAYILARVGGRILGGYTGGWLAGSPPDIRHRIGLSLMPQAGVALGLALVATNRMPQIEFILPLVIASTIIFELFGPPLTLRQMKRAGETSHPYSETEDNED